MSKSAPTEMLMAGRSKTKEWDLEFYLTCIIDS